mgnify:CR=1 FL=1
MTRSKRRASAWRPSAGPIRACAPHLVELQLKPAINIKARFGLVTIANKAEALFLPEIRKLINTVMRAGR